MNIKVLGNDLYLVRTQAGFNQAIKHWIGDDDYLYRSDNFNFPKRYPSIVKFYSYYQGYHGYNCNCTPLNEYKQHLNNLLKEME